MAVKLPKGTAHRRAFVYELVTKVGTLDMDRVWEQHSVPSHIVRPAVKDLEQAGLVTVERDRYVKRAGRR